MSVPAPSPAPSPAPHRRPVRVTHLIDGLGPGGAEHSLADLLPVLRAAGIAGEVVCLAHRTDGPLARVTDGGTRVTVLTATSFAGRLRELRRHLRVSRPDVLHTSLFAADVLGRCAAAGTGVPVLTSLVNVSYGPERLTDPNVGRLRLDVVRRVDGLTARHLTSHLHALTEAVRRAAVRDLGVHPAAVTVVPRGRDPSRLGAPSRRRREEARRRLGLDPAAAVVVNVARQDHQKGQRHLLDAAALLPRRDLVTLVVGREGHATADLRRRHEALGLGDRVRFLGNRGDVPDLLAAADVFVFPSRYEGLGGAVLEAMALGLPVVASDLPAIREVVRDGTTATLVPPASGTALAAAIAGYLDRPAVAAAHGAAGRQRFLEHFTLDRCGAAMAVLYRRVAGRPADVPVGAGVGGRPPVAATPGGRP